MYFNVDATPKSRFLTANRVVKAIVRYNRLTPLVLGDSEENGNVC
jgi:hypothetical protein